MDDPIPNLWNDEGCAGFTPAELLLYRSNLLGADLRITNFAGGNTSAKIRMRDPLTDEEADVLWVKGSGGDLGSMKLDDFATLYLDKLLALERRYRGREREDELVGYLPHCTFGLNPRAASIDTPLHAFLPFRHIDHLHPDSVIAVAATRRGGALVREVFGGEIGWLSWQRPGFDLGLRLREKCAREPHLKGIVLGGHGLMTWGQTSKACYEASLRVINRAAEHLARSASGERAVFGVPRVPPLPEVERRELVARLMPLLRGKLSTRERKIAHFSDAPEALEFASSARAKELAAIGTSCPDHFLRTKIKPLYVDRAPGPGYPGSDPIEGLRTELDALIAAYRRDYAAYYERCKRLDSPPMRDPSPVVILLPGVGLLTFARDKPMARQASEFYLNAIRVMRGACLIDEYVGLPEAEAFGIEYWPLEEAKLKRLSPERSLSRRVALVTGGAGGIGKATARRLLQETACVVLTDIDSAGLASAGEELGREFGQDLVRWVTCDVTDEHAVAQACRLVATEYGGLDILVCCAGLASSAPVEETTLALWQKNLDVLTTGYFLASREAFRCMREQGLGGSIVFVASKNALVASPNASAYCTAKAAVLHLARCLALEGAPHGIRVNTVNPDAVLRGSKIWDGEWRKERADTYGIAESELEEHYQKRSLLGRAVYPEDVAEAVYFFAADLSAKSTGNVLNVDAGHAASFPR